MGRSTLSSRCILAALALVTVTSPVLADKDADVDAEDEIETISLAKLVEIAVQQSSTLALAQGNFRKATLDETIAGASDEVQINAGVNVVRRAEQPIRNAVAQVTEESSLESRLGIAKRITTGGEISVSVTNTESSRIFGLAVDMPASANITVASLAMRQPILRGLLMGARVNEQKARLAQSSTALQATDAGAQVIRQLVITYWELAFARASLAVREQSLKLARDQAEVTKQLNARGLIPDQALKQASYGLALREESVLRSRRDLELGSLALRRLAGMEIGPDQIELRPTDPIAIEKPKKYEVDAMLELAMKHSPTIQAAKLNIDLANVVVGERENGTLPSLDLSFNAGGVGVGNTVGGSFEALGSGASYQLSAGVNFRWEIGGAAAAAAERARIDRQNAKRSARDIERDVIGSVVQATHEVRGAGARIEVSRRAIDLAQGTLATELALFKQDRSNAVQVFARQTELEEARLLEARASVDYQIAVTNLEYLTGKLLARYDVELTERAAK